MALIRIGDSGDAVRDIQERSPVIREQVEAGTLAVVGAIYDLETGRVNWLD